MDDLRLRIEEWRIRLSPHRELPLSALRMRGIGRLEDLQKNRMMEIGGWILGKLSNGLVFHLW